MSRWVGRVRALLVAGLSVAAAGAMAQEPVIYKCPGNLYTSTITPKEATTKGCKALEGVPVSVIQAPVRRAPAAATGGDARPADSRVDPADQKARDTDKRRILETELRREEERLASLKQEYNNGQPERRGDEKNYQKYLDRVAEMKASIERSESDVAALRREISKIGGGSGG
ncbi:hypothetical protein [Methylibium sp.]|uniref:hypothetical protein n=1 Tax=Methylibium sp. TaxID=2067992 RepID=UPI003D15284E